jgi:hypothetical protein
MNEFIKYEEYINEILKAELLSKSENKRIKKSENVEVEYKGIIHRTALNRTKKIMFYAKDTNGSSNKTHNVDIQVPDYKMMSKFRKMHTKDKIEFATQVGNLNINCDCNDFLYAGYKFMSAENDYGIKVEDRPPNITNPDRTGACCKHIIAVLNNFDKFYDEIIEDIDAYNERERQKRKK